MHELKATEPEVIGADIPFLLDCKDGFRTPHIQQIVSRLEDDAYYDEPGLMSNAHIYRLERNKFPVLVGVEHVIHGQSGEFIYKTMIIKDNGVIIAQAPYKIPVAA